jgi:DNA (cytosine-5)-methyltransferase 1
MRVGSLFSGIGGFDLGLERAGMKIVWQVENDPFCRKVLAKHWPDVPCYGDIHDVGAHNLEEVDVLCGGFPCQPVSIAGKRKAQDDERWLWPEFARIIRELRPGYVLVENVPGLLVRGFGDVLGDLASLGYDAEWGIISAASVGAPHLRKRIFIIAHSVRVRRHPVQGGQPLPNEDGHRAGAKPGWNVEQSRLGCNGDVAHTVSDSQGSAYGGNIGCGVGGRKDKDISERHEVGSNASDGSGQWAAEPQVGRVAHGISARVDRLKSLGNAIVPQVAEWVGKRILDRIHQTNG